MIKIKYPIDPLEQEKFNNTYLEILGVSLAKKNQINLLLGKVIWNYKKLEFDTLLTAPFAVLKEMNTYIFHHLTPLELEKLYSFFDYDGLQPKISSFFMKQHWITFDSCYYCNLDSIYSFFDAQEYLDALQFVNKASKKELKLIDGIADAKADNIIAKRNLNTFNTLEEVPVGTIVLERIKSFTIAYSHNHFTIDHFFHKDKYNFLSLSLYNFVPCCYACNSKFKKTKMIGLKGGSSMVSPSSVDFAFRNGFSFQLLLRKLLPEIQSVEDFVLSYTLSPEMEAYADFLKTFKIMGRYHYYKAEALSLIKKKVDYPESRIEELARFLGKTKKEIKNDLFGKEYFDSTYDQKFLVKFKRDIARDIKLEDVIED